MRKMGIPVLTVIGIMFAMFLSGCSPSEKEIIRAVEESKELKAQPITLLAHPQIIERGKRKADGAWPVKVKLMITIKKVNGEITPPRETTPYFLVYKNKDPKIASKYIARPGE